MHLNNLRELLSEEGKKYREGYLATIVENHVGEALTEAHAQLVINMFLVLQFAGVNCQAKKYLKEKMTAWLEAYHELAKFSQFSLEGRVFDQSTANEFLDEYIVFVIMALGFAKQSEALATTS